MKNNKKLANRMDKRMIKKDFPYIKKSLIDFCIKYGIKGEDVKINQDFLKKFIPFMGMNHDCWDCLSKDMTFKVSKVYNHLDEYLRNQIKDKGVTLQSRIDDVQAVLAKDNGSGDADDEDDDGSNMNQDEID